MSQCPKRVGFMKPSTGMRPLGRLHRCTIVFASLVVFLVTTANAERLGVGGMATNRARHAQDVAVDSPSPTRSLSVTRSPRSATSSPSLSATSTPLPTGPHQIRWSDFWYHSEAGVAPDDAWLTPAFTESLWPIGRTPSGKYLVLGRDVLPVDVPIQSHLCGDSA
jgi:hypothetical protein